MSICIGILTKSDPRHGLWRDAECLLWALEHKPLRRGGRRPAAISLFAVKDYKVVEENPQDAQAGRTKVRCPSAISSGTPFADWLRSLDVMIVCEKLMPRAFAEARRQGVRVIYIPNVDWTALDGSVERWASEVRKSGCEVWAKTERVAAALDAADVACELVPWSIPDPVSRDREARHDDKVTFLINAGRGGWRNRRGVDIALEAFAITRPKAEDTRLIVKSIRPVAKYAPREFLKTPGVELIEAMINREDLQALHQRADAVLYPSRWEGFGLSLLEALHAGVPAIATDGWPMNEFIEHGHNGLLARAQKVGTMRLAPHWECSPGALAQEMIRFATDGGLRRRITCPDPSELVSRQQRFILRVRELLLREPRPRVVLFRPRSEPAWRRSEEYWADALRMHGYTVDRAFFESAPNEIRKLLEAPHDFVLVSKPPVAFLLSIQALTDKSIVLWHHDRSDRMRRWMQQIGPLVDLICVPESGLNQRMSAIRTPTLTLLPGAKVDGDRGPGRRPIAAAEPDSGVDVVYLGSAYAPGHRVAVVRALGRYFDVHVYGKGWARHGVRVHPPVWSIDAAAVSRRAKTVLSVSNSSTTPYYTSNRLFYSCGVGACVVAEVYPGIDEHYPPEAVARFRDPQECVQVVRQLLADDAQRARMRALAEDHTWRNHTWADRISRLLKVVRDLPVRRVGQSTGTSSLTPGRRDEGIMRRAEILRAVARMWDQRARRLGPRAVGYFRWNEARFQSETEAWWERLSPYILDSRKVTDDVVLDFGCGTGRFAERLAGGALRVVSVDVSAEMVRMAAARQAVNARIVHTGPGDPLPFASGAFDALWVCIVLQHIPDRALSEVVYELRRVVRSDGLVLLCENTEQTKGRTSQSGHVVFRRPEEYLAFFPGLAVVDEFVVEGERHTVFAGRLST